MLTLSEFLAPFDEQDAFRTDDAGRARLGYCFVISHSHVRSVRNSVDEAMKLMRSVQEMWGAYQRYRQEREHFVRLREDRDWWKTYLSIKE